jgi:hypothetical protein
MDENAPALPLGEIHARQKLRHVQDYVRDEGRSSRITDCVCQCASEKPRLNCGGVGLRRNGYRNVSVRRLKRKVPTHACDDEDLVAPDGERRHSAVKKNLID